jgi:hypothetical protein
MKYNADDLRRGVNELEKRIANQINRIDATIDRSVKNISRELARLRELHQSLTLKREVLDRHANQEIGDR